MTAKRNAKPRTRRKKPDPNQKLAEMVKALDATEKELTKANKEAKRLGGEKAKQRKALYEQLEKMDLEAAKVPMGNGKSVLISRYELEFAKLDDREAFEEWAAKEDEAFFEEKPRLRGELLNQLVRQRLDDGEPLPPGVSFWPDERVSRTAS